MACWHITAELDRETGESAGAGGTFQVVGLEDDEGNDLTELVDQGTHFHGQSRRPRHVRCTLNICRDLAVPQSAATCQ